MKKKIALGLVGMVAIVAGVAAMSAYEAHVINVTAKIENALSVNTEPIEFGTVFPQEYLVERIDIALSSSFLDENRADDVEYVIRQKPKPKDVEPDGALKPNFNQYKEGGQFYPALYPWTIDNAADRAIYCHTHVPDNANDPEDPYYINCYPTLCPYLSKTDADPGDKNDGPDVPAFHDPADGDTSGRLAKSDTDVMPDGTLVPDIVDLWDIDLDVPCFEGQCAQDWTHQGWELPGGMESETFGCDLWIEVTGISRVD